MALTYLVVSGSLWALARKIGAANADEAMRKDKRRPIIYLRSFSADESSGPVLPQYGATDTKEQALGLLFRQLGPFIAIGDPSDALPDLGANRDYVGSSDWRDWVIERLSLAQIVLIRVGCSRGLAWEIETALKRVLPSKLVLFADVGREEYREFQERFGPLFPRGLPTQEDRETSLQSRVLSRKEGTKPSFAEFIGFLDDWTPVSLHSRLNWWQHYRTMAQGHSPAIRYASSLQTSEAADLARLKARPNVFEVVAWLWFSGFSIIYPFVIGCTELSRWRTRRQLRCS